jgi:ATP-dependent DNA helicase RecQ
MQQEPDEDPEEVALIVRKALSGVARAHGRFGLNMVAKLLAGKEDDRLNRSGLSYTRTFGALHDWHEQRIVRLLRRCVTAGWVSFSGDDRPVVLLTEDGVAAMRGERPARLLLPADSRPRAGVARMRRRDGKSPDAAADSNAERRVEFAAEQDEATVALFEALRAHRLSVARDEGVPPYMIASDRSLREIAVLRPRSRGELLAAHGIGPSKADKYGEGLLQVISDNI